jgi:hypothetical protein
MTFHTNCNLQIFAWRYFSEYIWGIMESHLMSTVEVRIDDEIYNYIMSCKTTISHNPPKLCIKANVGLQGLPLSDLPRAPGDLSSTQTSIQDPGSSGAGRTKTKMRSARRGRVLKTSSNEKLWPTLHPLGVTTSGTGEGFYSSRGLKTNNSHLSWSLVNEKKSPSPPLGEIHGFSRNFSMRPGLSI